MSTENNRTDYKLPAPYIYEGIIGKGGGGTVIKAYDTELRKYVVLKRIHDKVKEDSRRTEVDVLKNLNHRYIPAVHGFKTVDGNNYTVMDFVSGKSVGDLLKAGYKFKEKEVIKYAEQLCEALDYLHTRPTPVLHGDIKPDNIMIREDGDVCLIDFNISGNVENGRGFTKSLTPEYAAPEQMKAYLEIKSGKRMAQMPGSDETETEIETDGETVTEESVKPVNNTNMIPIDVRSDIYSLGATLFEMCAGIRISQFDKTSQTLDISEGLLRILNHSLAEDPDKRYQSVAEMLKALRNIYKGDRRYKAMVFKQNLARIFFLLVAIVGILFIERGYTLTLSEADRQFEKYVEILRTTDSDEAFEEAFEKAVWLKPDELSPYLQYEYRLFLKNDYEGCADFVKENITGNAAFLDKDGMADVYYVLGNCYLETKEYDEAVNALKQSIYMDDKNADAYVDIAVAYANTGNLDKAQESLDKAVSIGINSESLSFANGEIAIASGNYDKAIEEFFDCISQSNDSYRKMRAYMLIDEAYTEKGLTLENINARIDMLTEAKKEVSMENRFMVVNSLAQAYIDGSAIESGAGYEEGAIEASEELIAMGLGNVNIYSNVVILKQRISDYSGALETVKQMEEKFSDSYITMKRRAFLEAEMQGTYAESKRNYSTFLTYYRKATELYESQKNKSDAEMLLLEQTYQKLADGNWLD